LVEKTLMVFFEKTILRALSIVGFKDKKHMSITKNVH